MIYIIIIIINIILKQVLKNSSVFTQIINPLFWIISSIILLIIIPNKYINKDKEKQISKLTFITALIYVIIYSLFGIAVTFGKNPYSVTLKGLTINLWVTGVVIIGKEVARYKILCKTPNKKMLIAEIIIIVLFSILELDILEIFTSMQEPASLFRQVVSKILPLIIKNILFTFIAKEYNYKAPIIYELIINFYYWLSPILPNSPWILVAILDTFIPFLFYAFLKNQKDKKKIFFEHIKVEKKSVKGTMILGIILILIISFRTGIFPIKPIAVATGSMYPEINVGDVAIIQKCEINDIGLGDVIEYQLENQTIIHRIINLENVDGHIVVITKGDNNKSPDFQPVYEEQIKGKVIFKIKYLGFPSIWINNIMSKDKNILVETGK